MLAKIRRQPRNTNSVVAPALTDRRDRRHRRTAIGCKDLRTSKLRCGRAGVDGVAPWIVLPLAPLDAGLDLRRQLLRILPVASLETDIEELTLRVSVAGRDGKKPPRRLFGFLEALQAPQDIGASIEPNPVVRLQPQETIEAVECLRRTVQLPQDDTATEKGARMVRLKLQGE